MLKIKYVFVLLIVLALAPLAFADEPASADAVEAKEGTAAGDLGESSFMETEKRGLTFWKLDIKPKAMDINKYPDFFKEALKEINSGVKLKRFNILDLAAPSKDKTQFMKQLKAFYDKNIDEIVKSRATERGIGYDDEARMLMLTKEMYKQVASSAYVWTITIKDFMLKQDTKMIEVNKPNGDGTFTKVEVPHRYWQGKIEWQIDFYKFRFGVDEGQPVTMTVMKDNIKDKDSSTVEILPLVDSQEWAQLKPEEKRQIELNARDSVLMDLMPGSNGIEKYTKEIFIYIAKILSRVDQGVYARPGRADGMRVDDGFHVIDVDQNKLGYTKIRKLGKGYQAAGRGATTAEQDQTMLQIIKGDEASIFEGLSLLENPMMGGEFDLSFGYNLLLGFSNDAGFFEYESAGGLSNMIFPETEGAASVTLQFLYDLGRDIEVPEFWFGLDINIGAGDVMAGFVDIVFLKRMYFKELNVEFGGGLGGAFASLTADDVDDSVMATGFTAKLCAAVGYFISPSFEVFARLDLRFVFITLSDFELNGETFTPVGEDDEITFNTFTPAIEIGFRIFF